MIRRSPCEPYIKYLLTHPDGYSVEAVAQLLQLRQLDYLSVGYIDRLRLGLQPPRLFRPWDQAHKPSSDFLLEHKLTYLFHPDKPMREAHALLDAPRAKELIETLLICAEPFAAIAYRLRGLGHRVSTRGVDRYKFFFFNTDLVDSSELRALVYLRSTSALNGDNEFDEQIRAALKRASYADPRRAAVDAHMTGVASVLAHARMGLSLDHVDIGRMMHNAQKIALARSLDAMLSGHPEASQHARDFAQTASMLGDLARSSLDASEDLRKDLQLLQLKTDELALPHIGELSGGQHTASVVPDIQEQEAADAKR